MTREEAIGVLEESKRQNEIMRDSPNTFFKTSDIVAGERNAQKRIDAIHMAISALRQQDQSPESGKMMPLTLDELRKMDGEPVWVVYGEDEGVWALVEVCEESIFLTNNLGGRTEYADDVELEDDGLTVYRQKPKEADNES